MKNKLPTHATQHPKRAQICLTYIQIPYKLHASEIAYNFRIVVTFMIID